MSDVKSVVVSNHVPPQNIVHVTSDPKRSNDKKLLLAYSDSNFSNNYEIIY